MLIYSRSYTAKHKKKPTASVSRASTSALVTQKSRPYQLRSRNSRDLVVECVDDTIVGSPMQAYGPRGFARVLE